MNEIVKYQPSAEMMRRAELVKDAGVMAALQGDAQILKASTGRAFRGYSFQELLGELSERMRWIVRDIGYTVKSADDWQYITTRTAQVLQRHYGHLTLSEFQLAFELAVAGELNAYLPKDGNGQPDAKHYGQFSAEYVCKIMNAYKMKRRDVIRQAEGLAPRAELPAIGGGEIRQNRSRMRSELIWAWLHLKYRGYLPNLSPIQVMRFYEILAAVGLADDFEVTEVEQRAILAQTVYHYASMGMVGDLTRIKREGTGADELQGKAYILARKKALFRALNEIVKDDIDLRYYV